MLWSALVAAASATLVCTADMMSDPIIVSKARQLATGSEPPWYWIDGGPYIRGLPSAMGKDGIPMGNFAGWWMVAFIVVSVFYVLFQKPDMVTGKLVNTVPLLSYIFLYISSLFVALQLNWYVDGMNQVALIGTFSMMPVILICVVKLVWDYG